MDRTVLATSLCSPTPILGVHGINKKFGFLCLKNQFLSRFFVFTVRPPDPVQIWKHWILSLPFFFIVRLLMSKPPCEEDREHLLQPPMPLFPSIDWTQCNLDGTTIVLHFVVSIALLKYYQHTHLHCHLFYTSHQYTLHYRSKYDDHNGLLVSTEAVIIITVQSIIMPQCTG